MPESTGVVDGQVALDELKHMFVLKSQQTAFVGIGFVGHVDEHWMSAVQRAMHTRLDAASGVGVAASGVTVAASMRTFASGNTISASGSGGVTVLRESHAP